MAVTGWMLRDKTFKIGRSLSRQKNENEEDTIELDTSKDANENAFEVLLNICKKQGVTDNKRLGYLNILTKLIEQIMTSNQSFLIKKEDILCCLKVGLVSENSLIRAGGLRVIRYLITTSEDVVLLNKLQIPNLIARSIDLVLKNDHERIQAFRLALKILNLCPKYFSTAVTRSLVSLANSISENKDRMANSCLAILCQLCVLNPDLLIECSGQTALIRSTLEISHARINECLVGCLLFLLNKPETRNRANIHLEYLTSIYCNWQRKRTEKDPNNLYTSSKLSILAALRTWTGVFHLCHPHNISGMKAIIDVLYLNQFEVRLEGKYFDIRFMYFSADSRYCLESLGSSQLQNLYTGDGQHPSGKKAILELLFELFGLDNETWTEEIIIAMKNIDPCKYQDLWSLSEKFVAAEGKDILPNKACCRPNLTEVHTALIVYSLLECGLLSALVEVIITTDAILSVQAVILLGFILHLSHKLLPPEIIELSPGLPTLVNYAANGLPKERTQALMAVSSLCRIHELFKSRPAPYSLFLHQLLCLSNWYKKKGNNTDSVGKQPKSFRKKNFKMQIKNIDDHIKDSRVLISEDPKNWCWDQILTTLKCQNEAFLRLEEVQHKNFIRKLVSFYKPSSYEYCNIKYNSKSQKNNMYTTTSFALWDFLLQIEEGEPQRILMEFLSDLQLKLKEIVDFANIHEILFSPQQLNSTIAQHYFLMIGHMYGMESGIRALDRCFILQTLMEIVEKSKHEFYVKLILSSLNYNSSNLARTILSKAITSSVDSIRMYATELLLVLARSDVNNFSKWGLDLLIGQIYDENKVIAIASINILHELSYDQEYLESLINTRPSLLHLGDKGHLLLIRFLSTTSGFIFLSDANFVQNELENWEKEYNHRYVGLMEGDLHDCLTLYQRTEDGKYSRRFSNNKHKWKDVFVYPHLYGELSQHEKGFQALIHNGFIFKMIQTVQSGCCNTDSEILELKSSLWGLSNMATSTLGLQLLEQENLIQTIIMLAQNCPVLTVRATAFYSICLISTTVEGANALSRFGWYSVRRSRCDEWPVLKAEYLLMHNIKGLKTQYDFESLSSVTYESDETDSIAFENHNISNDVKSPTFKTKKASTLPVGIFPSFDEKHNYEKRSLESNRLGSSDEIVKSAGLAIFRKSHRRSHSESFYRKQRLSSDTSTESSEVYQNLSFQDALGLATLQSLHSYRRPEVLSNINSELEQSEFRKRFSSHDQASSFPSDFEAHNPPKLFKNLSSASLSSLAQKTPQSLNKTVSTGSNYSYQGISLPKALTDFLKITDVENEKKEERKGVIKKGSHNFSEMEQVKEQEEEENNEELTTSSSSDSLESERSNISKKQSQEFGLIKHDPVTCIACCVKGYKEKRQRKISGGNRKIRTDTESSQGNLSEGSPILSKWRMRTQSESTFQSFSCFSGDSSLNLNSRKEEGANGWQETESEVNDSSSGSQILPNEAMTHTKIRNDILKHVNRMCNPVWAKTSEQSLLHLKQSYPSVFQDPCLYSSVCDILSNSSCRVTARRFIQELFLDVSFLKIFDDAANVLQQYMPKTTIPSASGQVGDAVINENSLPSSKISPTPSFIRLSEDCEEERESIVLPKKAENIIATSIKIAESD